MKYRWIFILGLIAIQKKVKIYLLQLVLLQYTPLAYRAKKKHGRAGDVHH